MKQHLSSRLLSLLLVLALFMGLIVPVNASTNSGKQNLEFEKTDEAVFSKLSESVLEEESYENDDQYEPDDSVRVSIVLEEASTLERFGTADIATNASAAAYRSSLKSAQVNMAGKISAATGTKLDVEWNLTLAANLISANVRYDSIKKIEKIPGIKSVVIETRYEPMVVSTDVANPNMATSSAQIGSNTAWAAGYTGAGSKVAVIDTGIDYEHQSFSADGYNYSMKLNAEKKGMTLDAYKASVGVLTKDDLTAEVLAQLNAKVTNKAYLNDKIPFAYNYIDKNYTVDHVKDSAGEHGSHVEGIAAANAYIPNGDGTFSNALESVFVQGVAPDAQIVAMKVFGAGGGAYDTDYMAAIEDAIVLGCDSVNLSLGSSTSGFSRVREDFKAVMDSLTEHGVAVCISAGNSSDWASNSVSGVPYLYDNEISLQTDGSPGSFTNSLAVASVNNDGATGSFFTVGEYNVFYNETDYSNAALTTLAGEHDYVILPAGVAGELADYDGIDVTGKVVFVQRGSISFYLKGNNAVEKGAIATIVYNNQPGTINMDLSDYTKTAPCVSISQTDGEAIWAASTQAADGKYATGRMNIRSGVGTGQLNAEFYTMSDFSSWGIPGSLELKPEITAPGGSIYSVNGAHGGDGGHDSHTAYENMSGTSMASPQVAGMAALLGQYIRENKLEEKTGKTARQLINSLLMSTAEPIINGDSGTPYSILNQGAGLANVGNVIAADSYIMMKDNLSGTAADGKVKAEFGDDPEKAGVYTAEFTINNLSGKAQEYTFATDVFTQDMFEQEGATYLDTWTTPLAAEVSYEVGGQTFVPTSKVSCDVNRDGKTDADDAQCILEHVAGNHGSDNCDLTVADLDKDGKVTSYDAYLLLKGLTVSAVEVPVNSAVDVKVTIKLTEATKAALNENYPVGAYIEGFIYVNTANTEDGEILPAHSIPMLGFYGNWSDGSALDTSTFVEKLYGDERIPHTGVMQTNYQTVKYAGEKAELAYTINPYTIEGESPADIPYDRAAISSQTVISRFRMTTSRNAAAAVYFVQDSNGKVVYTGGVTEQLFSAYYQASARAWRNTTTALTANKKPSALGFTEGDTFTAGIALIPEYYEVDGAMTKEQVAALIESGKLGDGCMLAYTYTVDDTAPEVKAIQKDFMTGALTVVAQDNHYIAYVGVYKGSGSKLITAGIPEQEKAGELCGATFALDDSAGEYITVVVGDYAGNEVKYKVNYGGTPEDYTGRLFGFTSSTSRGNGTRWVEIEPEILSSTAGMTDYAEVDYDVYAAEYAGKYVFFATADGIYAAPLEEIGNAQKLTSFTGFDEDEMVADMAFSMKDKTMYVLTNHISDLGGGALAYFSNEHNKLYTLDLVTGELKKIASITTDAAFLCEPLRTMAVDANGNFYGVNNGYMDEGNMFNPSTLKLFQWKVSDIQDGALNLKGTALTIEDVFIYGYAAMTYDQASGKLYVTSAYGAKNDSDDDNRLFVIDPATSTATKPGSADGKFMDHVVGMFSVPANTIAPFKENADVTKVEVTPTELTLPKGTTFQLKAAVYPWLAANKAVTWTAEDPTVVSVDNGEIKTLKAGKTTVKAASVADPSKFATCEVTVEALPEVQLSGLIYNTDSKAYWAEFNTNDTTKWTKASDEPAGSYIAGALHEGELLVHNGSTMFGIDPDSFEVTSYGSISSSWIWSDAAACPTVDGCFGRLIALCMNGTCIELIDPATAKLSPFDLTKADFEDTLATIAYIGSGVYLDRQITDTWQVVTVECPANFYYVMAENGALYKFTLYTNDEGASYSLTWTLLGSTGLELTDVSAVTEGQYASMIYDQKSKQLLLSHYTDGETATLYVIDPDDLLAAEVGSFGEGVWPVVALYQHERATDLTLKLSASEASIYAGDSVTVDAKVILGSIKDVTWTSSNSAVAKVENGVITGVAEGTATITATTVATNKAGQHVSQDVAVTVKPLVKVNTKVNAQVATADGTAWVSIDLNTMTTTKLGDAETTMYGGGYAIGSLWGSDAKDNDSGHIYNVDAKTFEESRGGECSSDYAIRDLTENPEVSFKLTTSDKVYEATAFGKPIYVNGSDGLCQLNDYTHGEIISWRGSSKYPKPAAIAYAGYVTLEYLNTMLGDDPITECDPNTHCNLFYVLSADGMIYQYYTVPYWDVKAAEGKEVRTYLLQGMLGDAGITFRDVSALSAVYVELSEDNRGLLIADADTGSFYYAQIAGKKITTGKVGNLAGATNISCLYTTETASGDAARFLRADAAPMAVARSMSNAAARKGAERPSLAGDEDVSMRIDETAVMENLEKAEAVSMVKATVNKASGTLNAVKADGTTDKNADGTYNVIVKITDTESVGNAKYVLRYDPAKMTYVSSTSRNYSAIHVDETKGEITLAFANPVEVAAGTAIGTVKFLAEKNVETTVTVTTEERNANTNVNEAPATVKVDTTETPEVDKPIVIIPTKPGGTPADKKLPFTDVSKYDEFYDAVKYLYERDIMNGTSDTLFSPNAELTRGMVVTILYRMEGEPFTTGAKTFSDVVAGRYYSKAVEWAAENDIVNGFKDGTFKPNDPVTREQLAAIISRYAEFNGIVIYEPNNALASTDVVSNWAKKNVAWAAAEGILTPAQTANATKNATRAEVAMAIYTYLTKTAK